MADRDHAEIGRAHSSCMIREALPLPDKPSIAVLAFTNMSGDPEQEYFSDGIADDIITELVAQPLAVRHRPQFQLHLQGACGRHEAGRSRTRRALRAGRQRAPQRRPYAGHRAANRCRDRQPHLGRALRSRISTMYLLCRTKSRSQSSGPSDQPLPMLNSERALRKPPESLGAWEAYQRGLWHHGKDNMADDARARSAVLRPCHRTRSDVRSCPYRALQLYHLRITAMFAKRPIDDDLTSGGGRSPQEL